MTNKDVTQTSDVIASIEKVLESTDEVKSSVVEPVDGLVTIPEFWEKEHEGLLVRRRGDWLSKDLSEQRCKEINELYEIIASMVTDQEGDEKKNYPADILAKVSDILAKSAEEPAESTGSAEFDRIFEEDAVRTFIDHGFRSAEVKILKSIFAQAGDYHQGMGFMAAYLSLFLNRERAAAVSSFINHNMAGYFKLQNEQYLRDARVFFEMIELSKDETWISFGDEEQVKATTALLKAYNVDVANASATLRNVATTLAKYTVPGQYCSKWWIGMCVHVFPLQYVGQWIRYLLEECIQGWADCADQGEGIPQFERGGHYAIRLACMKFAIAMMLINSGALTQMKAPTPMIELLKFDFKQYPDDYHVEGRETVIFEDVLSLAKAIVINDDYFKSATADVVKAIEEENERRRAYEAAQSSDDEIIFSDEEED